MTEIIRKTFRCNEGGEFRTPDIWLWEDDPVITLPNGEETAISVPTWEIEIDLHDARLTLAGIPKAAELLRAEFRKLDPPQEVGDDDIRVHMPTGANHPTRGYNLRLTAGGIGVPPSIENLDGYKIEATERPYNSRPRVKPESAPRPTLSTADSTYRAPFYMLD